MEPTTPYLNVGSGPHYAEGWVNVDRYDPPEGCRPPDIFLDILNLPALFDPGSFSKVYLGHVLEHLEWEKIPEYLEAISAVCVSGAIVMAVGPCIHRAISTRQPRSIIEAILADPSSDLPPGAGHAWTPTEALTALALECGGLTEVTVMPVDQVRPPFWPNPSTAPWQTAAFGMTP